MGLGEVFWILMLIWLVFGIIGYVQPANFGPYWTHANALFLFILLVLLGWATFGFAVHR
jgi:hypothetical protein